MVYCRTLPDLTFSVTEWDLGTRLQWRFEYRMLLWFAILLRNSLFLSRATALSWLSEHALFSVILFIRTRVIGLLHLGGVTWENSHRREISTTGVNSHRCESPKHGSFWWQHVNKHRPKRENRTRTGAKVTPVKCKQPLTAHKLKDVATIVWMAKTSITVESTTLSLRQMLRTPLKKHSGLIIAPTEESSNPSDAMNAFETVFWLGAL